MGLMTKLKTQIDLWKLEKYTKRRHVATPDFEQKDRDFYRHYYQDGVYLHQHQRSAGGGEVRAPPSSPTSNTKGLHRKSTMLGRKSEHIVRCSETYNYS